MRYKYSEHRNRYEDDNEEEMDYESGGEGQRRRSPRDRRGPSRKHQCPENGFSYKDIDTLRHYVSEAGKIKPRRQTGNCAKCQRNLAQEIKRARHLALLPFVASSD